MTPLDWFFLSGITFCFFLVADIIMIDSHNSFMWNTPTAFHRRGTLNWFGSIMCSIFWLFVSPGFSLIRIIYWLFTIGK